MKVDELPEGTLIADGWDDALLGYGWRLSTVIAVYDRAKILDMLMADGATEEEADEYISFNIEGAYVGEGTPLLVTLDEGDTLTRERRPSGPNGEPPQHDKLAGRLLRVPQP